MRKKGGKGCNEARLCNVMFLSRLGGMGMGEKEYSRGGGGKIF